MKNLFHDNNNFKKKDEINNPNKYIGNNEKINKIFSTQKKIISNKNNNNNNKDYFFYKVKLIINSP